MGRAAAPVREVVAWRLTFFIEYYGGAACTLLSPVTTFVRFE